MKSIRVYLIVVLLSTICIVNFGAALNGYNRSTDAGLNLLDKRLVSMTLATNRLYEMHGSLDSKTFESDAIFQIWQDNHLIAKSQNSSNTPLANSNSEFHIVNSNGVQWRVFRYQTLESSTVYMYGERYDSYRKLIDGIILESLLPIVWVLPILAILIWLIVGYGLRPLKRFADTLRRRSVNELQAINSDGLPAELSPLVESTNRLFARLSDAFTREQRFAADAAHELRTPLAALKINLHNHAKSLHAPDENIIDLQASAKRMEESIEQILALYKLTPEAFKKTLANHNLKSVVQKTLVDFFSTFEAKKQQVELVGNDIQLEADEFALSMLIKNLIENASKYTPLSGRVLVTVSISCKDNVKVVIEDSGPGIPQSDYERVFDRFYRVGGDRHTSGVIGSGLGLSIVNHIVKLHNGSVELSKSQSLGGLAVTVQLPKVQTMNMKFSL